MNGEQPAKISEIRPPGTDEVLIGLDSAESQTRPLGTDEVLIGLEIHVYLATKAKLFCTCPADFLAADAPNTHVCPVCTGQPGAKPMAPNARAIEAGLLVAQALNCEVRPRARFLRKHYFYPDLPSNYQRTSEPFAVGGELAGVRITEIHWEEDPGSFDLHAGVVDYNRSGAPLLEIVTEPDFTSPQHARAFLNELRLILAYLGVGRGEAGIKADCNVSVNGGERAEVKNVNSVRNVEAALAHEVERQREAVARGETLPRETRHFEEQTATTVRLRVKESESDYRFIPDPDLGPVVLEKAFVDRVRLPETPLARRARIAAAAGVDAEGASPLFEERALVDAFDRVVAAGVPARTALDFLVRDLRGELEYRKQRFTDARVDADDLAALLKARSVEQSVTPQVATRVLRHGLDEGGLRDALTREVAATQAAQDVDLDALAREVIAEQPKAVDDYRGGKTQVVNFLVGQVMRKTKGRADVNAARAAMERALQV